MAVRIKDIACRANVSEATVSLALNHNPLVNQQTAKRIREIAREMGYIPNPYARSLVRNKSGLIGVVVPDIENVFYAAFVQSLNRFCQNTGYSLSIHISADRPENEEKIAETLIAARAEGIIYIPANVPGLGTAPVNKIREAEIPIVCATTSCADLPCVRSDLEDGMFRLVSDLLHAGRQTIAYLSGPQGVYALDLRENGMRRALQAHHKNDADLPFYFMKSVTYPCACEAAEQILQRQKMPDAIVCVNDMMALGVINTLKCRNIKIPEETAVAGFDDSIFSVASPVPITTVRQNVAEIAELSLDRLLALIRGENIIPNSILQTELIRRASTAAI